MTSFDMIHSTSSIASLIGKIQMRIESIVMGLLVSADCSLRMEEISKVTGYTAEQIRPVMQQLIANGSVKRSGNTRGTRYTAVAL